MPTPAEPLTGAAEALRAAPGPEPPRVGPAARSAAQRTPEGELTAEARLDAADARDALAHARDLAAPTRDGALAARGLRDAAAADREQAARERLHALVDREILADELAIADNDPLTGARTRAAGLADLGRELERCRRTGCSSSSRTSTSWASRRSTTRWATGPATTC